MLCNKHTLVQAFIHMWNVGCSLYIHWHSEMCEKLAMFGIYQQLQSDFAIVLWSRNRKTDKVSGARCRLLLLSICAAASFRHTDPNTHVEPQQSQRIHRHRRTDQTVVMCRSHLAAAIVKPSNCACRPLAVLVQMFAWVVAYVCFRVFGILHLVTESIR